MECGSSMWTLPPGITASCPLTTTRSPGLSPSSTTTSSSCRCPSFTGRSSAVESSLTTYTNGPLADLWGAAAGTSTAPCIVLRNEADLHEPSRPEVMIAIGNRGAELDRACAFLHRVVQKRELPVPWLLGLIGQAHLHLERSALAYSAARL